MLCDVPLQVKLYIPSYAKTAYAMCPKKKEFSKLQVSAVFNVYVTGLE